MVRKARLLELLREAAVQLGPRHYPSFPRPVEVSLLAEKIEEVLADPHPHRGAPDPETPGPQFQERDGRIYQRRLAGESYRRIARELGLSPVRVGVLARREWVRDGKPDTPYIRDAGHPRWPVLR